MRTRYLIACGLAALSLTVVAGCGDDVETATFTVDAPPAGSDSAQAAEEPVSSGKKPKVTVPDGAPPKKLVTKDLKEGTGPAAKSGDNVTMDYVGVSYSTKKEFDSSFTSGQPFDVTLGQGAVIAGWDEGIVGMKVGGRRELIIPPDMAYGAQGRPPSIKPNETLVFVVDLLAIN
ncbi:MAG TPA: FKBP-type peptidyl-prolyl cis-trans isomerase [Thermoleophilaceae bacterium]|nr:FKBP-type peptidyl-prolyl cis-trans isomerase [Thermoleophilaceae bacterium]